MLCYDAAQGASQIGNIIVIQVFVFLKSEDSIIFLIQFNFQDCGVEFEVRPYLLLLPIQLQEFLSPFTVIILNIKLSFGLIKNIEILSFL